MIYHQNTPSISALVELLECGCTSLNSLRWRSKSLQTLWFGSTNREEVRLLREELTDEYEADKQASLTQLSQQKELEMMAARESWQRKVEDLLEQVSRQPRQFFGKMKAIFLKYINTVQLRSALFHQNNVVRKYFYSINFISCLLFPPNILHHFDSKWISHHLTWR